MANEAQGNPIDHADALVADLDQLAAHVDAIARQILDATQAGDQSAGTWSCAVSRDPVKHEAVHVAIRRATASADRLQAALIQYRMAWNSARLGPLRDVLSAVLALGKR